MVPIPSLWLPILLSSVLVFFLSFLIHMVLPYHRADHKPLPQEDAVMNALKGFDIPPGEYLMPCPGSPAEMRSPQFLEKRMRGPVAIMTVFKAGPINMGPQLMSWFVFSLVVGTIAAYLAGRALSPGASYLQVFRFVGCSAFIGYGLALCHDSIWYGRPWSVTFKYLFDAMVYGAFSAGVFGWLWPK